MAVRNTMAQVAKKPAAVSKEVTFEVNGMEVVLTPERVRNYLVSGDKNAVSMEELAMFINLCKYNRLNPWLKEAYCIKYGKEPATMVIGKEAYLKRASADPAFDGVESGIIVITADGTVDYRNGTFVITGEKIVGGWAEVYRKDRTHSTRIEVGFDEYAGRKSDGSLNSQWTKKPATMIRKVALVQSLREAFPEASGGMITAEEVGTTDADIVIDAAAVNGETGEVVDAEVVQKPKKEEPKPAVAPAPVEEAESLI